MLCHLKFGSGQAEGRNLQGTNQERISVFQGPRLLGGDHSEILPVLLEFDKRNDLVCIKA
ncbi:hypothetical protein V2J09_020764 [Rumex salicifolius]